MIKSFSCDFKLDDNADQRNKRPQCQYKPAIPTWLQRDLQPEPIVHIVHHPEQLKVIVCARGDDRSADERRGEDHKSSLEFEGDEPEDDAQDEGDADGDEEHVQVDELLDDDEDDDGREEAHVDAGHEEADDLDEHGDEAAEEADGQGDAGVGSGRQRALLLADQERDDGRQDETHEEHDSLETSVT